MTYLELSLGLGQGGHGGRQLILCSLQSSTLGSDLRKECTGLQLCCERVGAAFPYSHLPSSCFAYLQRRVVAHTHNQALFDSHPPPRLSLPILSPHFPAPRTCSATLW